jgi:hypothetical protein
MQFKFDDKEYDSDKLSDNGKVCLARLEIYLLKKVNFLQNFQISKF